MIDNVEKPYISIITTGHGVWFTTNVLIVDGVKINGFTIRRK